jgi:hypothetical protein
MENNVFEEKSKQNLLKFMQEFFVSVISHYTYHSTSLASVTVQCLDSNAMNALIFVSSNRFWANNN